MKKSVAVKWVKALRSGKYKKGRFQLRRNDNSYCCLGVLCEVLKIPAVKDELSYTYLDNNAILPDVAVELAGMRSNCGELKTRYRDAKDLATLNDRNTRSFRMIANCIEKNWKDL